MRFQAPCCNSIRECSVRAHYIISLSKAEVLHRIDATRCYRGIVKYYEVDPSPDIIIVERYVSNRNVNYIRVIYKPENVTDEEALRTARKALGLEITEKIVLK